MSDALVLDNVTKTYNAGKPNAVNVLQGASVTVAKGEVVALVAPSGAGKSTLLHIAGLLDQPDEGTVQVAGQDVGRLSDRKRTTLRRQGVGFIYQFHHLLPEFTAQENIALPQLANGIDRATADGRAMDLLGKVSLESFYRAINKVARSLIRTDAD